MPARWFNASDASYWTSQLEAMRRGENRRPTRQSREVEAAERDTWWRAGPTHEVPANDDSRRADVPQQVDNSALHRAPIGPAYGKRKTVEHKKAERGSQSGTAKDRRSWWQRLQDECPLSLVPFKEMQQAPFELEAGDGSSVKHYFDGLWLASYLVEGMDFCNPKNRRPLSREECVALDRHVKRHHRNAARLSVADAFDVAQRSEADRITIGIIGGRPGLVVLDDHVIQEAPRQEPPDNSGDDFPPLGPGQRRPSAGPWGGHWGRRSATRSDTGFPSIAESQGLLEFGTGWDD